MVSFKNGLIALAMCMVANGLAIPSGDDLGLGLSKRDNSTTIQLDFVVRVDDPVSKARIERSKRSTVPVTLTNQQQVYYSAPVLVGSQKTQVLVDIDTGSSDLWVVASNVQCQPPKGASSDYCTSGGTFDSSKSSTFHDLGETFSISYGDHTGADGDYVTDNVGVPNGPTVNVQLGYVTSDSAGGGILGIGLAGDEATPSYVNYPQALKNKGYINKNAYSLWLNSPDATTGSLLFGGYDTAKYTGALTKYPFSAPTYPETTQVELRIDLPTFSKADGTKVTVGAGTLLDSGTTLSVFPDSVVKKILPDFGGPQTYDSTQGLYRISCTKDSSKSITYNFNQNSISVPYSALVLDAYSDSGSKESYCYFGLQPDSQYILGDNFLRYAYALFNLDDRTISIAQAKYTSSSSIVSL